MRNSMLRARPSQKATSRDCCKRCRTMASSTSKARKSSASSQAASHCSVSPWQRCSANRSSGAGALRRSARTVHFSGRRLEIRANASFMPPAWTLW